MLMPEHREPAAGFARLFHAFEARGGFRKSARRSLVRSYPHGESPRATVAAETVEPVDFQFFASVHTTAFVPGQIVFAPSARHVHARTGMLARNSFLAYKSFKSGAFGGHSFANVSKQIFASANEPAPKVVGMLFSSHARLLATSGRCDSLRKASKAQTVGSTSGSPGTP